MTVPVPKHWDMAGTMLLKFILLPVSMVLFWLMLNVKEPRDWLDVLVNVSDHVPLADVVVVVEDFDPPLHAINAAVSTIPASNPRCFMAPPLMCDDCRDAESSDWVVTSPSPLYTMFC